MEERANSQGQQCRLETLLCKMEALNDMTRNARTGIWVAVAFCTPFFSQEAQASHRGVPAQSLQSLYSWASTLWWEASQACSRETARRKQIILPVFFLSLALHKFVWVGERRHYGGIIKHSTCRAQPSGLTPLTLEMMYGAGLDLFWSAPRHASPREVRCMDGIKGFINGCRPLSTGTRPWPLLHFTAVSAFHSSGQNCLM